MVELIKSMLRGQYEATLCMLHDCIARCPEGHWEGKVAHYPFWNVAYHALIFADLYLHAGKEHFAFSHMHPQGWKEFDEEYPSRRFGQGELVEYAEAVRRKAVRMIGQETEASLAGPSGYGGRRPPTRVEMHVYNIRHIQHHTGQLSAFLRRADPSIDPKWAATGWKDGPPAPRTFLGK
jgi:uncharacterized damage-inducible protein DinB